MLRKSTVYSYLYIIYDVTFCEICVIIELNIRRGYMSPGLIVYKSKYGATEKYAGWLSQETGFDCVDVKHFSASDLDNYETVIFGSGIYASHISGLSFLRRHWEKLQEKEVAVFCVGAFPYEEKSFKKLYADNFRDEIAGVPCFYCRGAIDMDSLNVTDRFLLKAMQKAIAKKDPALYTCADKAVMEASKGKCDWTDKKYLTPVINFIG